MSKLIIDGKSISDLTVDDIRDWLKTHIDKQSIVDAYAVVHNKAWIIEDDIYDFEEGTTAYVYACEIADAWFALMDELLERVFAYLRDEGVTIPDKGWNSVVVPFMKKHGYTDGNGWWIKE